MRCSFLIVSHSARRPRTSRGRPNLDPYVSFPDVLIRRGREIGVASTSHPNRTYECVLRTPRRKRTSVKLTYGPNLGRPLDVTSEQDVLWTTFAEWDYLPISHKTPLKPCGQTHPPNSPALVD